MRIYQRRQNMKKLLIVESPAKIKTLSKFLGKDFKIMSTMGHVKDLPPKKVGFTQYFLVAASRAFFIRATTINTVDMDTCFSELAFIGIGFSDPFLYILFCLLAAIMGTSLFSGKNPVDTRTFMDFLLIRDFSSIH